MHQRESDSRMKTCLDKGRSIPHKRVAFITQVNISPKTIPPYLSSVIKQCSQIKYCETDDNLLLQDVVLLYYDEIIGSSKYKDI